MKKRIFFLYILLLFLTSCLKHQFQTKTGRRKQDHYNAIQFNNPNYEKHMLKKMRKNSNRKKFKKIKKAKSSN